VIEVGVGNETKFRYYPASIERVVAIEAEGYPRPRRMSAGLLYDIDDVNDISPWATQSAFYRLDRLCRSSSSEWG
jgi:hypothetical protein